MDNPKILYIDIENSRMVVEFETYSLYNIDKIDAKYVKHDWYITCVAWGWLDTKNQTIKKIESAKVSDFKSAYKKDFRDDRQLVKKIHKIISEADLIIGHNSDSFDIKKLNYRFIKHGLPAVDMPPTVDTLKAARKYAKATSNSLYYLAREFGVPMKIDLGRNIMHKADAGCEKSLKKLELYNRGDIRSGANLYFKLLPYIKNHPNVSKFMTTKKPKNTEVACGTCGSKDTYKWGFRPSKSGKKQRYMCMDCSSSTVL